jgi:hypothetical protein
MQWLYAWICMKLRDPQGGVGEDLIDAFERSRAAWWVSSRDDGCAIGDEFVPCLKARNFISEHMNN